MKKARHKQISWLPFDSRLIPPIFGWGHVHGIAKTFLILEMLLATGVVVGTLLVVLLTLWPLRLI